METNGMDVINYNSVYIYLVLGISMKFDIMGELQ